jgi:dephospho-CoA kinase
MGKSTTAQMFADEGAVVWNADEAVHRLYSPGGAAVGPVGEAFPGVVSTAPWTGPGWPRRWAGTTPPSNGWRPSSIPWSPPAAPGELAEAAERGVKLAVLDIPLLFEGGGRKAFHAVVVVTADPEDPGRTGPRPPGMTRERFEAILERQTPDAEKRRLADFIVETDRGLEAARDQVRAIVHTVLDPDWTSPRQ